MTTKFATDEQLEQIRRNAVNSVTRDLASTGIKLTWEQADDLGDEPIDWLRNRLGLKSQTTDAGITFTPTTSSMYGGRGRYYIRIKKAPHEQWMVPAGWSWDDLDEAKTGASKADAQWMAVELIDSETDRKVQWR